jgi:hypothetical protein
MIDKVPSEKQSMDFTTLPNTDIVIYQVTSQHWAHAEQIRWTLLYNLLVANTILLLAWAAIFATNTRPAGAWLPLTSLSFGRLCVSLLWIFLQRRANRFSMMYTNLGQEIEKSLPTNKGPFQATEECRNKLKGITGLVQTHRVLVGVPCLFVLLFLVLCVLSVRA